MAKKSCKWINDEESDFWRTSCNNAFTLTEGTPTENRMVYCPYCGVKIVHRETKEKE